jgi:hypothetical protein
MKLSNRKRALIGGSAVLLVGGLTAGGALITAETTILDNKFTTNFAEEPVNPTEKLKITNPTDAFDMEIEAFAQGADVESKTWNLSLPSTDFNAKVGIVGASVTGAANPTGLVAALDTVVEDSQGNEIFSGSLAALSSASSFVVDAGGTEDITMTVKVSDPELFKQALNNTDADATLNLEFQHIYQKV